MKRQFRIPALLAIPVGIYAIGFVALLISQSAVQSPLQTNTVLLIDHPAPDFALSGIDGKIHHLKDYSGKRIVLNFWATWCVPCRQEMPLLQKTYAQLQSNGLVVIGVDQQEDAGTVSAFLKEVNVTYPILLDNDLSAFHAYGVMGIPITFFIDTNGIVRAKSIGALTDNLLQQYLDHFPKWDSATTTPPH